jgi:dihydroflavonol-4-reductase
VKVLVLGGTGFLGHHTVRAFLEAGHEVAVMVRERSPRELLDGMDVEFVLGDLKDAASLERAFRGRDWVVHQAGVLSLWDKQREDLFHVNVLGTRRVVEACLSTGVKRLIYAGSVGIYAGSPDPLPVDERGAPNTARFHSFHVTAMCLAEAEVYRGIAAGLDAVLLHPSLCLGTGDRSFHSSWAVIGLACLRLPVVPTGGINVVAVEDVARTHVAAAERAPSGSSYLVGGENLTNEAWTTLLHEVLELPSGLPTLRIGGRAMRALGDAGEWFAKARGADKGTYVTLNHALGHAMSLYWWIDDGKAQAELGHQHSPVRPALERQVAWLGERGLLPGKGFGLREFAQTFLTP